MQLRLCTLALFALCGLGPPALSPSVAPAAPEAPPAAPRAGSLPASLDDLFSRFEAYGFSGAVLVARHGEILLRKGYGLADRNTGTPVSPQTVFDVGSITKQFTAAAILRLEMEGKLSTADPLSRFLPAIAKSVGGELPAAGVRPDLAAITLHQMLSHTAGIDDFYSPADLTLPPAPGIAGRYTLPTGGEIEVAWRNGRPVLSTEDPEAILRLTFPDVLAPDEPADSAGEDAQMTRIFRGIDQGDWEPARAALSPGQSFPVWQGRARAWWEAQRKALGAFVAVRPVEQIEEEFHDTPELQIFLRLDFERGRQVMRALRGAGGRYDFRPEKIPERVELTLAPQAPGTYAVWSFRYRAGPRIVFEPGGKSLRILGSRSSVTANRKTATDAARTGG